MFIQTNKLLASLCAALLLSACGSSSSSSNDASAMNDQVDDVTDNSSDLEPGDSGTTDSDPGTSFVFDRWAAFPNITYTTLDQLPPMTERLYGGLTVTPRTTGAIIGTGEFPNEDLIRDIPFVIDGEVTEGLVIEKLYAVKKYVPSKVTINGEVLPDFASRLDMPSPRLFAIVTNLSSIDLCGINTWPEYNQPAGVSINMKQGGSLRVILQFAPGVQFLGLEEDDNRTYCINSGGSVVAYTNIDFDKFSEFNVGSDYADIEDIESINIARLTASPKQPIALERGLVTLNYIEYPRPSLLNQLEDYYEQTVVNQSAYSLKSESGRGFVLDPQTLLPLASVHLAELNLASDYIFAPGEEVSGVTSRTGIPLLKTSIVGTSNVMLFVNGYKRD